MDQQLQPVLALAPGSDINGYLATVNTIPVLTPEQERGLTVRLHDENDLDAARQLVLSHLRFVVHIARSYNGYGLPLADLIQEGNVGLMKAVKRFDHERGVRLVSFAVHWIKAEIHEFVLRNWRIVKVATTKAQRKLFFNLRSKKEHLGWLSHKEAKAVAADLGVDLAEVQRMEGRLAAHDAAFDGASSDDEEAYAPAHYLQAANADPAVLLEAQDWEDDSQRQMHAAIAELDERARDIIASRWLSEEKSTLHELAEKYGVSAERIRQLEANALKKMRGQLDLA